jgi:hypothetical protein
MILNSKQQRGVISLIATLEPKKMTDNNIIVAIPDHIFHLSFSMKTGDRICKRRF